MSKSNICGISGMGFYIPEKKISIKKLAKQAGIPEFVVEALGAATVREAAANEYPSDMAIKAARAALEKGGIDPLDIDLIIYCGAGVPDYILPHTAGKIQYAIGAENAFGFDLSQGCCGMLTAIQLAKGYISIDEGITNVMLVTGDKWSQFTRFHSADSVFFGDGGGAAVISRGHHELFPLSTEIITKGEFYDLWCIQAGALRYPASEATLKKDMHTYVCLDRERARHEFKELYIPGLLHVVRGALKKCSLNPSDVSYFDMVNNNLKVQKAILKELGISVDASSARYLQKFGHFGAQDIFLNLDMAVREKRLRKAILL